MSELRIGDWWTIVNPFTPDETVVPGHPDRTTEGPVMRITKVTADSITVDILQKVRE